MTIQAPMKKKSKKEPSLLKASSSKKKAKDGEDDVSKKKKQKKKKDPNAPKRAISAFMFFCQTDREVRIYLNTQFMPTIIYQITFF